MINDRCPQNCDRRREPHCQGERKENPLSHRKKSRNNKGWTIDWPLAQYE